MPNSVIVDLSDSLENLSRSERIKQRKLNLPQILKSKHTESKVFD